MSGENYIPDPGVGGRGICRIQEKGMALLTTLLVLTLMTLSGFALLYFSTMDVRASGNDRVSRGLLHRIEALNLYVVQDLWNRDPDEMLRGSPARPEWIYSEKTAAPKVREGFAEELAAGKSFNALVDKDLMAFMKNWPAAGAQGVFSFTDSAVHPFLADGSGRALVVDCGVSGVGSQDIGGPVMNAYIIFSEYQDGRGDFRILETGMLRKQ